MKRSLKKFYALVDALESLPTVGKKSAVRLAFHMVLKAPMDALKIAHAIEDAVSALGRCVRCGGLSEDELCHICSDEMRNSELLCVVERAQDIYVIEESGEYHGYYFVFDRLSEETVERLKASIEINETKEIIFAFTPSIQNDALMLYIEDQLKEYDLRFTKIAQGVPTGVQLENVDALSLAKAISDRVDA